MTIKETDTKRLPERLRAVRTKLSLTQREMAEAVNVKYRSWQDYETGKSIPGGKVLAGLAALGINTNWLLTGSGPARLKIGQGDHSNGLLQVVIDAIRGVLAEMGPQLTAAEKGVVTQAFTRLYRRLSAEPESVEPLAFPDD